MAPNPKLYRKITKCQTKNTQHNLCIKCTIRLKYTRVFCVAKYAQLMIRDMIDIYANMKKIS